VINKMVKQTNFESHYLVVINSAHSVDHKFEHLTCFAGGMFALGASSMSRKNVHLEIGKGITKTCHEMYNRTATGISPDSVLMKDGDIRYEAGNHYLLRPEAIESFFYLWRLTGNRMYREWAWQAFEAFEKYLRTPNGYSGIRDVMSTNPQYDDLQQSFWLAETMKYLYLTFLPVSAFPLDAFVFNTEAHPFKVWKEGRGEYEKLFQNFNI